MANVYLHYVLDLWIEKRVKKESEASVLFMRYADDIVMQENADPPTAGKDANRQREIDFFSSVENFHGAEVRGSAAGDDISFSEWMMDVTASSPANQ